MNTLTKYRIVLAGFVVGLVISGVTAIPLNWEVSLLVQWAGPYRDAMPGIYFWLSRVQEGLAFNERTYPFMAYGTDWLAFGHLMIALAYWGPWRDQVRNRWVLEWGMLCCVLVLPAAALFGPLRQIRLGWRIVDSLFGIVGIMPLYLCWRWCGKMEEEARAHAILSAKQ